MTPMHMMRLLQTVARSFSLSVRLLPSVLRPPVALAYLLARSSDTVADSCPASGADSMLPQLDALEELLGAIQASALGAQETVPVLDAVMRCIARVPLETERQLLKALPTLLTDLQAMNSVDRGLILRVCETIVSGQRLDVLRFSQGSGPQSVSEAMPTLTDVTEFDDYTWRVAGSVGHFWSHVCEAAYAGSWRGAEMPTMLAAGCRYGMGLQRLNLLRDSAADLAQRRCYWPAQQLATVGLDATVLADAVANRDAALLQRMHPLLTSWFDQIRLDLGQGIAYCLAIRPWRLRLASALPALIGLHTVQLLEAAGPLALSQPVKVSRAWLRRLLWRLLWGEATPKRLQQLALELGAIQ